MDRLPSPSELAGLTAADVATVGKGRVGVVRGLSAAWPEASAAGPAFTARGRSGDNLAVHRALAAAPAGAVIVAVLDGEEAAGHWGELLCVAAHRAGIAGAVVAGTIRDVRQIRELRFPVFFDGTAPNPAAKRHAGTIGEPVSLRGALVRTGDLVVADVDGIAIVPYEDVDAVVVGVRALRDRESELTRMLEGGLTTMEALGLEAE